MGTNSQGRDHDHQSRMDFLRANTRLLSSKLVPEIRLYLAEQSLPIWEKTEEVLGDRNLPPPYWAFAWVGGQALARYILDNPELVAGRRIVDLGSGSGIVAIAAKCAGAKHVLAADIDPFASAAALINATANNVHLDVTDDDILGGPPGDTDVLLVGDLFYERGLSKRVIAFMEQMAAADAAVLVGDPRRKYFPAERFTSLAQYDVPTTRELEDQEIKSATVWRWKA